MVTEVLEGPQLVNRHAVAHVQIGPGRVEPLLDGEGRIGLAGSLQLLHELGLGHDLLGALPDPRELFFYWKKHPPSSLVYCSCRAPPERGRAPSDPEVRGPRLPPGAA
jgi:hypothetical protein